VLLTECADQVFEGMTIAGYALGSTAGIVYLRENMPTFVRILSMCSSNADVRSFLA